MAKKSLKVKAAKEPKFQVRSYMRCQNCGRSHAVLRRFRLCRICLRKFAYKNYIPGIKKSSW